MSSRSPFRRGRGEEPAESEEPGEEEATTDASDLPTGAELGPAPSHGDCAICHQPITSDQDYVSAAYGLVHTEVCASQTYRQP